MNEETFDILDVYATTIRTYISELNPAEKSDSKLLTERLEKFITTLEFDKQFNRGPLADYLLINHLRRADWKQILDVCMS